MFLVWQAPTDKDNRTFISTGDIPAMWLRDSQNQVVPYLHFVAEEMDGIGRLIRVFYDVDIDFCT